MFYIRVRGIKMVYTEEIRDRLRKMEIMNENINTKTDARTRELWAYAFPPERQKLNLNNKELFDSMVRIYNGLAKLFLDKSSSR